MKRLHVHVSVDDLATSMRFYAALFAVAPTVVKPDYAKWMLDDPRVNFAISQRGRAETGPSPGIDHLGIQVEDDAELREVYGRLQQAEGPQLEQGARTCCYAESEKAWIVDPQGVYWETFLTLGASTVYGDGRDTRAEIAGACCDKPALEPAATASAATASAATAKACCA